VQALPRRAKGSDLDAYCTTRQQHSEGPARSDRDEPGRTKDAKREDLLRAAVAATQLLARRRLEGRTGWLRHAVPRRDRVFGRSRQVYPPSSSALAMPEGSLPLPSPGAE
jgi:hypothetical protein